MKKLDKSELQNMGNTLPDILINIILTKGFTFMKKIYSKMLQFPRELQPVSSVILSYLIDEIAPFESLLDKKLEKVIKRESKYLSPEQKTDLLSKALIKGRLEVVKFMIESLNFDTSDINIEDVIKADNVEIVRYLFERELINMRSTFFQNVKSLPMFYLIRENIELEVSDIYNASTHAHGIFLEHLYEICPQKFKNDFPFNMLLNRDLTEEQLNFVLDHIDISELEIVGTMIIDNLSIDLLKVFTEMYYYYLSDRLILHFKYHADKFHRPRALKYILEYMPISQEALNTYISDYHVDLIRSYQIS